MSTRALFLFLGLVSAIVHASDRFDAAVASGARPPADLQRDARDHPAELLRLTGIEPGMTVADVLGGDGYFSELAANIVGPKGRVLLINNAAFDGFSENLGARLKDNRLSNVRHLTVDLNRMHLPDSSIDALLLVKVYHDLYWVDDTGIWPRVDAKLVLAQLSRALKPGGVILLVDHSALPGTGWRDASRLHRIDEAFAVQDFEALGFKVVARSELLRQPNDARDEISYKGRMLTHTDRFVLVFRRATR